MQPDLETVTKKKLRLLFLQAPEATADGVESSLLLYSISVNFPQTIDSYIQRTLRDKNLQRKRNKGSLRPALLA